MPDYSTDRGLTSSKQQENKQTSVTAENTDRVGKKAHKYRSPDTLRKTGGEVPRHHIHLMKYRTDRKHLASPQNVPH